MNFVKYEGEMPLYMKSAGQKEEQKEKAIPAWLAAMDAKEGEEEEEKEVIAIRSKKSAADQEEGKGEDEEEKEANAIRSEVQKILGQKEKVIENEGVIAKIKTYKDKYPNSRFPD